jgi:hypothetical protein
MYQVLDVQVDTLGEHEIFRYPLHGRLPVGSTVQLSFVLIGRQIQYGPGLNERKD